LVGERKVATMLEAIGRVETWRSRGLAIGFTNGVFDLLHPGHISLLGQARAACDRLVIGLNSDASVRGLKGPDRPVQTEAARAAVVSSLSAVDLVVVFAEDTPIRLIEALRPDVLVKGADYALGEVVGAGIVEGYGGRVLLADLLAGHSTTATIERLSS
jgi:D-beta-D-heptose 7-phosphate kinase/D-beta-D-heptose 1-phosphate adenosyltransferase